MPRVGVFLVLGALVAAGIVAWLVTSGGETKPSATSVMRGPAFDEGMRLFDEAIRYVAKGQEAIPDLRDFYADLDLKLERLYRSQEGRLRVWFQTPRDFRQELTAGGGKTTEILTYDGIDQAWIVGPNGRVERLHGTPTGESDVNQLRDDRALLSDVIGFVTLKGLKGPGVTFERIGPTTGSGTYAGEWMKLNRRSPRGPDITFWLAYVTDANGVSYATWPGIVRVWGDPAKGYPTEDYILKEWDSPRAQARDFRYPYKVEAYQIEPGKKPSRFLWAMMLDVQVNAGMDPSRFAPPP